MLFITPLTPNAHEVWRGSFENVQKPLECKCDGCSAVINNNETRIYKAILLLLLANNTYFEN